MVISSVRPNDAPGGLALFPLAAFAKQISADPTPLLVFRAVDFAEVAWRLGRRAALRAERRCASAFAHAAQHVLRASDVLGHDAGSAVFIAALTTPGRGACATALPPDCRATLGRIASAMELATGLRMESGWTVESRLDVASLDVAIETALERGAREREQYAFFSLIGHELRTPLTSIRGYLEVLLEDDVDPASARTFLEVALTEALRLGRFIDGLFELSLIDAGLQYAERSCDAAAAVEAAVAAALPAARQRGITLVSELPRDLRVRIESDRFVQVVGNLIDNAIKHGTAGGVVRAELHALDGRFIELTIDDDGPGIAASERESIFALGYRSAASGACGTGIGLAVTRLILERVGGEIDVIQGARGGACFRARLPRAQTSAALAVT